MPRLDRIDVRILQALQEDGRISNTELAERVGLSPSPCLRRVKALEDGGVISRYVGLLDPRQVGLPLNIFISVTLDSQERRYLEAFEGAVGGYEEIMECYLMTGSADYLLRVVVPDLAAYERLLLDRLSRIPGVTRIQTSVTLKQVIYRTALPLKPGVGG